MCPAEKVSGKMPDLCTTFSDVSITERIALLTNIPVASPRARGSVSDHRRALGLNC